MAKKKLAALLKSQREIMDIVWQQKEVSVSQVREILAVTPSLSSDDFTTEPIFVRSELGEPMRWTGSYPPEELVWRIDKSLPSGASLKRILHGDWSPDL